MFQTIIDEVVEQFITTLAALLFILGHDLCSNLIRYIAKINKLLIALVVPEHLVITETLRLLIDPLAQLLGSDRLLPLTHNKAVVRR